MNRNASTDHNNHSGRTGQPAQAKSAAVDRPWLADEFDRQGGGDTGLSATELQVLSRKGLWGLLAFLLAGVAAFMAQDFNLYRSLPETVLQILGCPPPETLVHLALAGYSFTVVVPVLIRIANGDNPQVGWRHLFCRAAFYLFYLASATLSENLLVVIIIGVLLYVLEQVGIWAYRSQHLDGSAATS